MRRWSEPSARNLLRRPWVLGVPTEGLLGLSFISLTVFAVGGGDYRANFAALGIGVVGYVILRIFARIAKTGWDEALLSIIEKRLSKKQQARKFEPKDISPWKVSSPDTLTESDLLLRKDEVLERVRRVRKGDNLCLSLQVSEAGAELSEYRAIGNSVSEILEQEPYVYSLYQLPVVSDPVLLFSLLKDLPSSYRVWIRFRGMDGAGIKRRIELARRSNAQTGTQVDAVDSEVSFEEASLVLQGISRGDDSVLEASLVVSSKFSLDLDPELFVEESRFKELALLSVTSLRKRLHRSHVVRAVTASDLIPNVLDPKESGSAFLKTLRDQPLYFSPQDPRLEALHWLVVGASGSGKSFFTGLVLHRMIEAGTPMSVLFVDHNRSFRRLIRSIGAPYFEPKTVSELNVQAAELSEHWNRPGTMTGIELSELPLSAKKKGAQTILSWFECFLKHRDSTHPIYLVLDECWNFLREDPALVQGAFREYRKLNGAVIAITQSLGDFLSDESGQSIFQNAPIRILLRQGEDLTPYRSTLSLNSVEMERLPRLRQERGRFSEFLIKTPYLSRIGRLYPSEIEHSVLRTDNLREEIIREAREQMKEARL